MRVEVAVVGFGLNTPVIPEGRPVTERVAGELKPLVGLSVTVFPLKGARGRCGRRRWPEEVVESARTLTRQKARAPQ